MESLVHQFSSDEIEYYKNYSLPQQKISGNISSHTKISNESPNLYTPSLLGLGQAKENKVRTSDSFRIKKIPLKIIFRPVNGSVFERTLYFEVNFQETNIRLQTKNSEFIHLEITFNPNDKSGNLNFQRKNASLSAVQYLDMLKIISSLASGTDIELKYKNNPKLMSMRLDESNIDVINTKYFDLIGKLAFIQKIIKKPIVVPDRNFSGEETARIFEIYEIINKGQIERDKGSFLLNVEPKPGRLQDFMVAFEHSENKQITIGFKNSGIDLFGTEIDLGPVQHKIFGARLDRPQNMIENGIGNSHINDAVGLTLVPEGKIVSEYEKWILNREREFIRASEFVLKKNAELYRRLAG